MNNKEVKKRNYQKFRHAGVCGCAACQMARTMTVMPTVKCDYFDPEDFKDDDGWF